MFDPESLASTDLCDGELMFNVCPGSLAGTDLF